MNFDEENNNYAKIIRNETNEIKVNFIQNVLSKTEIPPNFIALRNTNINKIFYQTVAGASLRRNYVLFESNKFYCVYCLCFSLQGENLLVQGVGYVPGCRITEKLTIHDTSSHHNLAKRVYLEKSKIPNGEIVQENSKRNVIRVIMKIIIFLATHGKCNFSNTRNQFPIYTQSVLRIVGI